MKKINQITFNNFKAFFEEEKLKLDGKNLLLYGENGSGKSSVYWGLYTFLQSSGKTLEEINKYFVNFDEDNPTTYESLKNVFSGIDAKSSIEMETIDDTSKVTTGHKITFDFANTNMKEDITIALANASSDFIHYKLLYNFYDLSHKHELNLWKVFIRDIFPYFRKNEKEPYYKARIDEILKGVPMSSSGKKVSKIGGRPQTEYVNKINELNNDIQQFIYDIETYTNDFLKMNFYDGKEKIKIELNYFEKIDYKSVRNNDKEKYKITLFVKVWDENRNDWITIKRPQSFLNEAILTRVAFSIRIGALRTRLHTSDYKILCLDDLLISLDMANRDKIIQIILNAESRSSLNFFDEYQKLIFTHDKAFFNLCKQRIQLSRKENEWIFKEMYWDTDQKPNRPYINNSTDYFERAEKHLKAFDYPASANALRQGLENLLVNFLPNHRKYTLDKTEKTTTTKQFNDLLEALKNIHTEYGVPIGVINDLFVSKDHLLNPLSHDNVYSEVYKEEIQHIIIDILPQLRILKTELLKEAKDKHSIIKFRDINTTTNKVVEYQIFLKENLYRYTLLDGNQYLSKGEVVVLRQVIDGVTTNFDNPYKNLNECIKRLSGFFNTSYTSDDEFLSKIDFQ